VPEVRRLLQFVLNSNFFRFGNDVYRQKEGVAMGNNLAPPFAIIVMHYVESKVLSSSPYRPQMYKRYVDDVIMIWLHGGGRLRDFIRHCNSSHPKIRFTAETSEDAGKVDYMDVSIAITAEGKISHRLFQKPCHSGLLIDYTSAVPAHVKKAVVQSQFLRALRLSSDEETRAESDRMIMDQLRVNHYPENFIAECRDNAKKPKRRNRINPSSAFLKLPYKSDRLHANVTKLIRKYSLPVRVVYEHTHTLRSTLCRSALLPPACKRASDPAAPRRRGRPKDPCIVCSTGAKDLCGTKNIVYLLRCRLCSERYVGETEREFETRAREHNMHARNKITSEPWGQHFAQHHPGYVVKPRENVFSEARILARERDRPRRKIREAVEIKARKPEINISAGWQLT